MSSEPPRRRSGDDSATEATAASDRREPTPSVASGGEPALGEVRAMCRRCGTHTDAVVTLHGLSGSCGNCGACDLELIGV